MILGLLIIVVLAVIISWAATRYYGERQTGQEKLLPERSKIITFAEFRWGMNDPAEVIIDPAHAPEATFEDGKLTFLSIPDTYIYLNTRDQKLSADYHFFFQLRGSVEKEGGTVSISLIQGSGFNRRLYVSERIPLNSAETKINLDLQSIKFYLDEKVDQDYIWGEDFSWADGLRLDIDHIEGSHVTISEVRIRAGVSLEFDVLDQWLRQKKEFDNFVIRDNKLELNENRNHSFLTTQAIGIGSIERFYGFSLIDGEGTIITKIRSGDIVPEENEIIWSDWIRVPNTGRIDHLPVGRYFQARFRLRRQPDSPPPCLSGFRLRYIDAFPLGTGGPIFGTIYLPTYLSGKSHTELLNKEQNVSWIRLPADVKNFDNVANKILASDTNVICSVNLDNFDRSQILGLVRRYQNRIVFWEFLTQQKRGSTFYTDLFSEIREIEPSAFIFPEQVGPDYFQKLSMRGQYQFATASGTQEEVLNRGFLWFFVLALLGLLIVTGLGPVTGYHFKLGLKELKAIGAGLLLSVVILVPVILISGLAGLTLPRDFAQIEIAFNRYAISALLQEFARVLLLLLPVGLLVRSGIDEKKSWIAVLIFSSVLFGLGHVGYPGLTALEIISFVVLTTIAGLIFGGVFYWTRSLTAVVIIHLLSNVFMSTMTTIGTRL